MASGLKVGRRFAVQTAGRGVALILHAVAFGVTARLLDVEQLGVYAAALSLFLISGTLAEFGLQNVTVLEMTRRPESETLLCEAALVAACLLGAATLVFAAVVSTVALSADVRGAALFMVPAFVLTRAFVPFAAVRQHRLQLLRLAVAEVAGRAVTAGFLAAVLVLEASASFRTKLGLIGIAMFAGAVVSVAVVAHPLVRQRRAWVGAGTQAIALARTAVPLGLTNASSFIHMRIDQVIIAMFGLTTGLASYAVAYRVVDAGLGLAGGVGVASFSLLAKATDQRAEVAREVESLLLVIGSGGAIGCFVLAPVTIRILAGPGFDDAVHILRLLSPVILVSVVNLGFAQVAVVQDQSRKLLVLAGGFAFANALLNVLLIPHFGVEGSVAATITTETFGAIAVALVARRSLPGSVQPVLWTAAVVGFAIASVGALEASVRWGNLAAVVVGVAGVSIAWGAHLAPALKLVRSLLAGRLRSVPTEPT